MTIYDHVINLPKFAFFGKVIVAVKMVAIIVSDKSCIFSEAVCHRLPSCLHLFNIDNICHSNNIMDWTNTPGTRVGPGFRDRKK